MGSVINFTRDRHARHSTPEALIPAPYPADELSFVKRIPRSKGGGIDNWAVKPTGSYVDQCEEGKRLAVEFLSFIGQYPNVGNAILLSDIILSMIEKARQGQECRGLYVGFLSHVGRYTMAMAAAMRPGEIDG